LIAPRSSCTVHIMSDRLPSPLSFVPLLAALLVGGGAHAATQASPATMPVQVASSGVLAPSSAYIADDTKAAVSPVRQGFQPAPMPDQDADAPSTYVPRGAELSPALFSHKSEFAGDGYAPASDPDHGLDNRRTPAAGLNWSVPVK
jgi:hypothetical protein